MVLLENYSVENKEDRIAKTVMERTDEGEESGYSCVSVYVLAYKELISSPVPQGEHSTSLHDHMVETMRRENLRRPSRVALAIDVIIIFPANFCFGKVVELFSFTKTNLYICKIPSTLFNIMPNAFPSIFQTTIA